MLDTPATVAASICLLARWRRYGDVEPRAPGLANVAAITVGMRHDRECGWCIYPKDELLKLVVEHNEADAGGMLSYRFRALQPVAQRALVDAAQGFERESTAAGNARQ